MVLAGGRSTRFGSDKAAALLGGRPLIDHAARLLGPHVDDIVAAGGPARGLLQVVPDLPRPGLGPLGGLAGALGFAAAHGYEALLTIACDTVAVPDGLFPALLRRAPSYAADSPTTGHWPARLFSDLQAFLADWPEQDRGPALRRWAEAAGALPVTMRGSFANINTPADLAPIDLASA